MIALISCETTKCKQKHPYMVASIALVERCGDAMIGLRPKDGRLSFECSPTNRVAELSALAQAIQWAWGLYFFEKRYMQPSCIFVIDGLEIHIDEQAQQKLRGSLLDLVDRQIVARVSFAFMGTPRTGNK